MRHLHADKLRKYHIAVDEVICDTVLTGHGQTNVSHCAVVYDQVKDFGDLGIEDDQVIENPDPPELLPSQKIDSSLLSHLKHEQKSKNFLNVFRINQVFVILSSIKFMAQKILNQKDCVNIEFWRI